MDKYSYINNAHPEYVDQMYKTYLDNPESVDDSWRMFFTGYQFGENGEAKMIATFSWSIANRFSGCSGCNYSLISNLIKFKHSH